MPKIHPTAIVDPRATLAEDVEIGPYAILQGNVMLGPGTVVHAHSVLNGTTVVGRNCRIGPAAYVGLDPQHLKYDGYETHLIVGDDCVIRENASLHRAFRPGVENATRVGNRCFLMATSHVAHDCVLEDEVTMANGTMLGGHCHVAARVFIGGGTGIHQHVRIGRLAMLAGNEPISRDVPPFSAHRYGGLKAYNAIGCRRAGFPQATIHAIRAAYTCLHSHRTLTAAIAAIEADVPRLPEIVELLAFLRSTKRGIAPSIHFRPTAMPIVE